VNYVLCWLFLGLRKLGRGRQEGSIGILAFGSLIEDPGPELDQAQDYRLRWVLTPFKVEFARSSRTRGGAPTLVPVMEGGARVSATLIILKSSVPKDEAKSILWRREMHKPPGNREAYAPPRNATVDTVLIEEIRGFYGLQSALFTQIGSNITPPRLPEKLAALAVQSAVPWSSEPDKDGVSYLLSVKKAGIQTPLMRRYEKAILKMVGAKNLKEALFTMRKRGLEEKDRE